MSATLPARSTTRCSLPSAGRRCAKHSPSCPAGRRDLLLLLLTDPPLAYEEISARLGIPIGSIGPTRARALEQLRRTRALRGLGPDPVGGVV